MKILFSTILSLLMSLQVFAEDVVKYYDADGNEKEIAASEVTVLDGNTDVENLAGGWYVAMGELTYQTDFKCSGDVNLILADDAVLMVTGAFESNGAVAIYRQGGGTGSLTVGDNLSVGDCVINGGVINVGGYLYGADIVINGGNITLSGNYGGLVAYSGDVTINGGTVSVPDALYGIYSLGNVNFNGGMISVANGVYAIDIILGYSGTTDYIKCGEYIYSGSVKIKDGQAFKVEGDEHLYAGTLSGDEIISIRNQTLIPVEGVWYKVTTPDFITATPSVAKEGDDITFAIGNVPEGVDLQCFANGTKIQFGSPFTMPAANVTVTATATVSYIDGEGNLKKRADCQVLTASTEVEKLEGGWYVAIGKLAYSGKIYFDGDSHLILADGASLTCRNVNAISALDIYGQTNGTGRLVANNDEGNAISATNITINGGNISATGVKGIYGANNIIINGGIINADGISCGDGGSITLGYNKMTDRITASSFSSESVIVNKVLKDEDDPAQTYTGELDAAQIAAIAGMTLMPGESNEYSINTPDFITGQLLAEAGTNVTLSIDPQNRTSFKYSWNIEGELVFDDDGRCTFTMPAKKVTIFILMAKAKSNTATISPFSRHLPTSKTLQPAGMWQWEI